MIKSEKKKHILLELATTYPRPDYSLSPEGCHYDLEAGAWILSSTNELLVKSPDRPRPTTKKNDVETGEDQKGQ